MIAVAAPVEFAVYLAPGLAPLSEGELTALVLQTADLVGCDADELKPVPIELLDVADIERELLALPVKEQSREPYAALLLLLRSGARPVGNLCSVLVYDLHSPFSALDYLKGLVEITRLPVFLGICRRDRTEAGNRHILVRRLR